MKRSNLGKIWALLFFVIVPLAILLLTIRYLSTSHGAPSPVEMMI